MTADQDLKFKELTQRLVAMSPEPPPFPEEVIMTAPDRPTRRTPPALMFAGAAALVILGAAIPLLLFGPGPDEESVATSLPGIDTTMPLETSIPTPTTVPPTSPSTTDNTIPQAAIFETVLFLVTDPAESSTGNPALVPFNTTVTMEPGAEMDLLSAFTLQLLANPDQTVEAPEGFYNAVPQGVEIYDANLIDGDGGQVLQVSVSENFADGAGGLLADVTMLNQIVYTATWWSPDMTVQFLHQGVVIDVFGTEGILIGDGVTRNDFIDELNLIVITSPFILGGDELPQVAGIANVFEATVSLRVVWAESGEVVYEDFTTATCGTGCWGDFSFTLDVPGLETGQLIQVFWNSPEDGRMLNVVTYPVGADGAPWNFFPDLAG